MYQQMLVMLLHNTVTGNYHPIYYAESPMPGPMSEQKIMRYKSKGHHTAGYKTHDEAVESANKLADQLRDTHNTVSVELDVIIEWNDTDIPVDTQVRPMPVINL